MIFTTFDPYNIPNEREAQDCFICYELFDINNKNPIRLDEQNNYIKICNCDGWVHDRCLNHWCKRNKKCPICRNIMDKHVNYAFTILNENILKHISIYSIFKKFPRVMFVSFSFFLFIICLCYNYDMVDFYPLDDNYSSE